MALVVSPSQYRLHITQRYWRMLNASEWYTNVTWTGKWFFVILSLLLVSSSYLAHRVVTCETWKILNTVLNAIYICTSVYEICWAQQSWRGIKIDSKHPWSMRLEMNWASQHDVSGERFFTLKPKWICDLTRDRNNYRFFKQKSLGGYKHSTSNLSKYLSLWQKEGCK